MQLYYKLGKEKCVIQNIPSFLLSALYLSKQANSLFAFAFEVGFASENEQSITP